MKFDVCVVIVIMFHLQVSANPTSSTPSLPTYQSRDSSAVEKCTVFKESSFRKEIKYSKTMFLCSTADVASTIDYSKVANIKDGVVDSLSNNGHHVALRRSPSPLRIQTWTSPSNDVLACKTPERKLCESVVVPTATKCHATPLSDLVREGMHTTP